MRYVIVGTGNISNTYVAALNKMNDCELVGAVCYQRRTRPDNVAVKRLMDGGPFMQQACHNLDIYTWLFGKPTQVVSMLGTFAHDMEAEDHQRGGDRYHGARSDHTGF